jgi:bacillithiol biosynthesis cysteine-adding enzyme BshC
MRRLATDYAYDFRAVAPFYAGDPVDPAAWARLIDEAPRHDRPRREVASLVGAQQAGRGAPAPAVDAGRLLAREDTVAVVTGQQAGLFGGPLFTLLKALTALQLAECVRREHHRACVAVFWIDAEDHDWDEVRSCTVLDESLAPQTISLPARHHPPASVASVQLDGAVQDALAALERVLPATEFRPELLAALRAAYAPGRGMAEAFGRWLESLLGDRGLVVFDASDGGAKPLVRGLFGREVSAPGETARRAARAGADLEARGYHAQVQSSADALALFALTDGREPIRIRDGHMVVGDRPVTRHDLEQEVMARPAAFSPNVLLRPLVQDTLFPTICYVAGPNELAYLGQLGGVYEHFGVPMPLMYPRASVTLLDGSAMRFLTRYGVALEDLQARDEAALNDLLKSQIPDAVETAFTDASRAVAASMTGVIARIASVDPTLESTARSTAARMQHDLDTLHGKLIQAAKRRDDTLRRQFSRTQALAFPKGQAQERTVGFVSFLNQYGPALVDRLEQAMPLDFGSHWVIAI